MISVVTVSLNAGESLKQTVQSVLEQEYFDWELVVQDGGSTDGSIGFILEDPRIKFVTAPDSGIYNAMNQALIRCSGEYVCFLNAGDLFFSKDVLRVVADLIESSENSANLYYGNMYNCSQKRETRYPRHLSEFFLYRNTICHQAQFISRDLLDKLNGYSEAYSILADYDFYLRAHRAGLLLSVHIPKVLVSYDGAGVSACITSRKTLDNERRQVIARNFSMRARLFYRFLHCLTLVHLRRYIYRSEKFRRLRPVLNKINHLVAK